MKTKLRYITICLMLCSACGGAMAQDSDEYLEKARSAYDAYRYDDAITYALKGMQFELDEQQQVTAWWICAASYQAIEFYSEAIFYQKKMEYLNSATTYYNSGLFYGKLGYDKLTMEMLGKALEIKDFNPKVYNARGGMHTLYYRMDEARADYEKSIEQFNAKNELNGVIDKATYLPYFNMGVMYELIEEYENAVLWFEKAFDKDSSHVEILLCIENVKSKQDKKYKQSKSQLKKTLKGLDEAVARNRWDALIRYQRAQCYAELGYKDLAKQEYELALKLYDDIVADVPDAWVKIQERGFIYDDMKRPDDALRDYRRVLELNPATISIRKKVEELTQTN